METTKDDLVNRVILLHRQIYIVAPLKVWEPFFDGLSSL
jgi:hypothetical protein